MYSTHFLYLAGQDETYQGVTPGQSGTE